MLQNALAYYCTPTFAGIKPSSLFSYPRSRAAAKEIAYYNALFCQRDIYFEILYERGERILILVYRKKLLKDSLQTMEISRLLCSYGYPAKAKLSQYLQILKERLRNAENFPHEIGAFLGYRAEDIVGFIQHKGQDCKLNGYWKVYGDAQRAREQFARYDICRSKVLEKLQQGRCLEEIFCAE